jgi:hypothetical protein
MATRLRDAKERRAVEQFMAAADPRELPRAA